MVPRSSKAVLFLCFVLFLLVALSPVGESRKRKRGNEEEGSRKRAKPSSYKETPDEDEANDGGMAGRKRGHESSTEKTSRKRAKPSSYKETPEEDGAIGLAGMVGSMPDAMSSMAGGMDDMSMASMSMAGEGVSMDGEKVRCKSCEKHQKRMQNYRCLPEYSNFVGPCVPTQMEDSVELFGLMCPAKFYCIVQNGIDFGCCGKYPPTKKQIRQEKSMSRKQKRKMERKFAKLMKARWQLFAKESQKKKAVKSGENKENEPAAVPAAGTESSTDPSKNTSQPPAAGDTTGQQQQPTSTPESKQPLGEQGAAAKNPAASATAIPPNPSEIKPASQQAAAAASAKR